MKIGDRVRVVGPGKDEYNLPSYVFEIAQLRVTADGLEYSANGFPWFPEESLELVEEEKAARTMSVSFCVDTTEIERAIVDAKEQLSRFAFVEVQDRLAAIEKRLDALESRLQALDDAHDESCRAFRAHIRENLPICKEEPANPEPELKVGDWVEIDFPGHFQHGTIFRIIKIDSGDCMDTSGELFWDMRYLHKLSDEEIARRLNR